MIAGAVIELEGDAHVRLAGLGARMKADTLEPCKSTGAAYREIIPALWRQRREPEWFVRRQLPASAKPCRPEFHGEIVAVPAE